MARKRNDPQTTTVSPSLSHDGAGVVRFKENVVFVEGALPGEEIIYTPLKRMRRRFIGRLEQILSPSPHRVEPPCEYFGVCGGCAMQHLDPKQQIIFKAQVLVDNLTRIGKVEPHEWLAPMQSSLWHYRRKARPGVRFVPKKGGILVGFRERAASYITSLMSCKTLDERISHLLPSLHQLIEGLSIPTRIPQVEVAAADNTVALILRHLDPLSADDLMLLAQYAEKHAVQLFLQPGGLDTIAPLWPAEPEPLYYDLTEFDLRLQFRPFDFIQVNGDINQRLVAQAVEFLALTTDDAVLDLFCGLGNFTLPVARSGASVLGIEGEDSMVQQGRLNAEINAITNASFEKADLHSEQIAEQLPQSGFNKLLLDPPRSGAYELVKNYVPRLQPGLIVYVSCNPATLARDADVLVNEHGYTLAKAGAVDMFPQTAHVESIAVFTKTWH